MVGAWLSERRKVASALCTDRHQLTTVIKALKFFGRRGNRQRIAFFWEAPTFLQEFHWAPLGAHAQREIFNIQHQVRLTFQHACGHGGLEGNEAADCAAALGANGNIPDMNNCWTWIAVWLRVSVALQQLKSFNQVRAYLKHIRQSFHNNRRQCLNFWFQCSETHHAGREGFFFCP